MTSDTPESITAELERLRSIVSDTTEFIKRWLPDGTRTYVNDAYCQYFGEEREAIIGTSFFPFVDPRARQLLEARIRQLTPENPVIIDEYPSDRDGTLVWLEWTDRAIFDTDRRLVEMHSIGRDVTDRHYAVESLRESEERYRSLVEEALDAIIVASRSGQILHMNSAGLALLGFASLKEALETDIRSLYVNPRALDETMKRLVDTGKLVDRELVLRSRDGRELTILQSASVIRDAEGKVSAIRTILHDITRRRQLEMQLQHAQRLEALGKLAGGVAHDFNNLLTVIGGNAELMAADLPVGGPHRVAVESIREAAERAVGLTQQLLAYGRRQMLSPEQLDLNRVVSQTISMLRRVVGEDIEILTSLAPDLGVVEADPNQVKQVLVNLALN
ncbi:MAG: PAS domain S-box protein, partial [Acidobacteriota bacterium]|nr:PAS domain S-box protein [Acidobacteriota bacterium]